MRGKVNSLQFVSTEGPVGKWRLCAIFGPPVSGAREKYYQGWGGDFVSGGNHESIQVLRSAFDIVFRSLRSLGLKNEGRPSFFQQALVVCIIAIAALVGVGMWLAA